MQTVYRVYEGTREPHRLAVERTAEVLGRGGLALIPTRTVCAVAVAVNAFSDAVPQDTSEFPSWPRDPQAVVNRAAVPALVRLPPHLYWPTFTIQELLCMSNNETL